MAVTAEKSVDCAHSGPVPQRYTPTQNHPVKQSETPQPTEGCVIQHLAIHGAKWTSPHRDLLNEQQNHHHSPLQHFTINVEEREG